MRNTKITAVLLTILLAGCGTSGDVTQGRATSETGNVTASAAVAEESGSTEESVSKETDVNSRIDAETEMTDSSAELRTVPASEPSDVSSSTISNTDGSPSESRESDEPADNTVSEPESIPEIDGAAPGMTVDASLIADISDYFKKYEIAEGDDVWNRITGKSYRENTDIALSDLRYLKMLHYNYDHEVQVGEMIVNAEIADDTLQVFRDLYENQYEIESMFLIDDFWTGDSAHTDENSMEHNNTSAFNYRMTTSGKSLSNHALGLAIDVNPLQNPYVYQDSTGDLSISPVNAAEYTDRAGGSSHMIRSGDICQSTFEKYGFAWGGYWNNPVDYQHFEK